MSSPDVGAHETGSTSDMLDQPFASSEMGHSMDSDLLPELSGETWVAAIHLDEVTGDLPPSGSEPDLITASRINSTLSTVREWVQMGAPPSWVDCAELSPELHSWHLQFGNLSIDSDGRLWRRRTSSDGLVGANESCLGRPSLGPGCYGHFGHVGHYEQGESVCPGYIVDCF